MASAVKKALGSKVFKPTGLGGGGCISSGASYITDTGNVFVKVNNKSGAKLMFDGEKAGLEAILATGEVKCPKPIMVVTEGPSCSLVMESLEMKLLNSTLQSKLGEQLARMHLHNKKLLEKSKGNDDLNQHNYDSTGGGSGDSVSDCHSVATEIGFSKPVKRFGFYVPTSCGFLSQNNSWNDNWTDFYVNQKLQPQVDMLLDKKRDKDLQDIWTKCRSKIEQILNQLPDLTPALVHGDLWSGNVASENNIPVIFDPAVFYGHSEYDFGIANMFGGFSLQFYESYFKVIPKSPGFSERQEIYELFHHLNHWNHFGSGYRGSSLSLMKKITCFS